MKEIPVNNNINDRVESIIKQTLNIYINRLKTGYYEIGLEATFQLHFSKILQDLFDVNTLSPNERFEVLLEKNLPVNGNKDYIDVVIRHTENKNVSWYLIELKFKKETDSAPDLGNIESYKDMYTLDCHKTTSNVKGCYYIFMTDYKTYLNKSKKGTRTELPMHDLAKISPNQVYNVTNPSAVKALGKYANTGLKFSMDHTIEYEHFKIGTKDYWYFIEKM